MNESLRGKLTAKLQYEGAYGEKKGGGWVEIAYNNKNNNSEKLKRHIMTRQMNSKKKKILPFDFIHRMSGLKKKINKRIFF